MDASQLRFVKRKILNEVSLILDRELEAIASGNAAEASARKDDDAHQGSLDVKYAEIGNLYESAWKR